MWKLPLIALAVAVCVEARPRVQYKAVHTGTPFIVGGGQVRDRTRWPWQLSLELCVNGDCGHTCGAILLAATKGLTAAHCTSGRSVFDFRVIAGAVSQIGAREAESNVTRTTEHPNYSPGVNGLPNDVATLLLTAIQTGPYVQFATLTSDTDDVFSSTCFISGWGKLDGNSDSSPVQLYEVQIDAINRTTCQTRMSPVGLGAHILDQHQCVHHASLNRGSCQGDSGGPLNCQVGSLWKVAGVISWQVGSETGNTCVTTYPSVCAKVAYFRNWIDTN